MYYQLEQLKKSGKVTPKRSLDIKKSKLGIGFEKLDRNVFDPNKAYDKLALVGVKWVRIQSGWQRTERERGVYNFEWIDSVVDNLLARGMQPWVCLCYGNDLYIEAAKTVFGAAGCAPVQNEDQKNGWANYVRAFAEHFNGRVKHYEVWNEPDGIWCWKHGVNAAEYAQFVVDTANAVHEKCPDAQIFGGSFCIQGKYDWLDEALEAGMADVIDAVTFHEYTPDETHLFETVPVIRALCHQYNPNIKIIQGESGSQSRSDGHGALRGGAWTPERQAKQCLRHAIADLICGVEFSSYFSCMDMIEALNGTVGNKNSYMDYGYFGILGADFDENGFASGEYTPKTSYYAYQNLCSVFAEDFELCDLPIIRTVQPSRRTCANSYGGKYTYHGFKKPNGAVALAYWNPTELLTTNFESVINFNICGLSGTPRIVDLLTGIIYDIPETLIERRGGTRMTIKDLPITDYPMLLTFGDLAE